MENKPVKTIPIHDHLRSKLCDLYENDCIFDKFEALWGPDGKKVLTGSYNNYFHIFDKDDSSDVVLQADKSAFKAKKLAGATKTKPPKGSGGGGALGQVNVDNVVRFDFSAPRLDRALTNVKRWFFSLFPLLFFFLRLRRTSTRRSCIQAITRGRIP